MTRPLCIAHLYPDLLNLYADKGNIRTLEMRCQWRGIEVRIESIPSGQRPQLQDYDLVLLGGGSDREQEIVARTLRLEADEWKTAVANGLPLLAVCGGYQLLGEYYQLADETKVPGLGILDLVTTAGTSRLIGNIAIDSPECGTVVGFENHAGRTVHAHEPLGTVIHGHGNDGSDGREGVRHLNIVGTYIHGPLLPKNPRLADFLLQSAIDYGELNVALNPIDDDIEEQARLAFQTRRLGLHTPQA